MFLRFQGRRVRVLELLLLFILIYHLLLLWSFRLPALFFPRVVRLVRAQRSQGRIWGGRTVLCRGLLLCLTRRSICPVLIVATFRLSCLCDCCAACRHVLFRVHHLQLLEMKRTLLGERHLAHLRLLVDGREDCFLIWVIRWWSKRSSGVGVLFRSDQDVGGLDGALGNDQLLWRLLAERDLDLIWRWLLSDGFWREASGLGCIRI